MIPVFSKTNSVSALRNTNQQKSNDDSKVIVLNEVSVPKLLHGRKMGGKGFTKSGLKPMKTTLAWSATISSSANTILNSTISVDLLQSAEFSSFAALYDLVKCVGGRVFWSVDSAGGTPTDTFAILTYDPEDSSSYNSTSAAMVATYNTGPMRVSVPNLSSLSAPQPVCKRGMWEFKFKCPNVPQKIADNSSSSLANCTGMWASTNLGSTIKYGYIKPVVEAAGTSVVTALHYFISVDVEFRSRT